MLGMSPFFFFFLSPGTRWYENEADEFVLDRRCIIHFSNGNVTNRFLLFSSTKFDEFLFCGSLSSFSLFLFDFYFDDVTLSHVREIESSVGMERARVFAEKA